MTYLLFNNEVYGLTQGQGAPTLQLGLQTKSLPAPNIQESVNGPSLAFASGFTWIGRGLLVRRPPPGADDHPRGRAPRPVVP